MSRVSENREAQRIQQERQALEKQKTTSKEGQEKFAKLVNQKQQETGEANRKAAQQSGKHVGQKAGAHAALMARSGIQSNKFAQLLQQQGKANLSQGEASTLVREKGQRDTRLGTNEKNDKVKKRSTEKATDSKEGLDKVDRQGDKLAAISRDDRQSQGDHQEQDAGTKQGLATGQAEGTQAPGEAQAVQGANAPQIPPHIIQEIVKRVFTGVNEEGLNEFHIQFKDDVLGGAGLQITADGGKITAKFTTNDKNAQRLLKASEGELARAFGYKGLSLERLEVEQR